MATALQILLVVLLAASGAALMHRRGRLAAPLSPQNREFVDAPFVLAPSDVEEQLHELRRRLDTGRVKEAVAVARLAEAWGIPAREAAEILKRR